MPHYWTPNYMFGNRICIRCKEEDWSDAARQECGGGQIGPRYCPKHIWETDAGGLIDICIRCGEERA